MDVRFDPRLKSIFVPGLLYGPDGELAVRLAVDTGATRTLIRVSALRFVGCDLTRPVGHVRMTSATGAADAPLIAVRSLAALDSARSLPVVAHELPDGFQGHGLLGRDYFDGLILTVDFARSTVRLRPPRPWWRVWR
jgi:predicted aspartyl protease